MNKFFKHTVCAFALISLSYGNNAFAASVLLDAKSAAGGLTTWTITTTHINELIIISCGGYGVSGATLSTAPGTVKVNGTNATYETRGLWLDPNFSWTETIWAYVAPAVGTYTCTCTETGLISPFYFNFAASCYETGVVLGLGNILIGGNSNNHGPTTITASITTTQANSWIYGSIDNNDNGGTGTVAFNSQLTLLNKTYINNGVDGAQADSTYAAAGTYNITSTDIGASNVWMTFVLIAVQPVAVLPVDLLYFNCSDESNGIDLKFATATEDNSDYFTIERSDGISLFNPITKIKAAGNSTGPKYYEYTDEEPLSGNNYYRLSQTDFDGNKHYYSVTTCSTTNNSPVIYPNPFSQSVNVEINETGPATITIFNMMGQSMGTWQADKGVNTISTSSLPKGVYLMQLKTQNSLQNRKLCKVN